MRNARLLKICQQKERAMDFSKTAELKNHIAETRQALLLTKDEGIAKILSDAVQKYESMLDKEYLLMHNHPITYIEKQKLYKTIVDMPAGSDQRYKTIRSANRDALDKKLIAHYKSAAAVISVGDVFDMMLEYRVRNKKIKPSTRDRWLTDFKRFFIDTGFSKRNVAEVTKKELIDWSNRIITQFNLTRRAWGNVHSILKFLFEYAQDNDYSSLSISSVFNKLNSDLTDNQFRIVQEDPRTQVFTDEEVLAILNWIRDTAHPERLESNTNLGILIALLTGMRCGEIATLKASDFIGNELHVTRSEIRYKDENGQYHFEINDKPKGKDPSRTIIVPNEVIEIVRKLREKNPDSEYLFVGERTHKRLHGDDFSDKLARICKYLKIPVRRLHKLRKTYATMLFDADVPESVIANQMGHRQISTTRSFYYKNRHQAEKTKAMIDTALSLPITGMS